MAHRIAWIVRAVHRSPMIGQCLHRGKLSYRFYGAMHCTRMAFAANGERFAVAGDSAATFNETGLFVITELSSFCRLLSHCTLVLYFQLENFKLPTTAVFYAVPSRLTQSHLFYDVYPVDLGSHLSVHRNGNHFHHAAVDYQTTTVAILVSVSFC